MSTTKYALYWIPRCGKMFLTDEKKFTGKIFGSKVDVREAAHQMRMMPIYNNHEKGSFFYKELDTNKFMQII